MTIADKIQEILSKTKKMYCTPGHKGELLPEDITEIDESFPALQIEQAQEKVARFVGAKAIRFLLGGSSMGIKAALFGRGDIIAPANCHQSIKEAAELSGKRLFFFEQTTKDSLILPPSFTQVAAALEKHQTADAVVLCSPDYYGHNSSALSAKLVKKKNKYLHIDAAHAAHYPFRKDLFDNEIFSIADSYNLSAHKTLFAPTMTAYLCINSTSEMDRIDHNLRLLGTTSPLYPLFAALENAADKTEKNKGKYDELLQWTNGFRGKIPCTQNDDFTRLVVDAARLGMQASTLYFALKKRGIIAEKYDERYVVFIVTLADSVEDLQELAEEILHVQKAI
jgi:arginine/lysine/ornithine decarboxylase